MPVHNSSPYLRKACPLSKHLVSAVGVASVLCRLTCCFHFTACVAARYSQDFLPRLVEARRENKQEEKGDSLLGPFGHFPSISRDVRNNSCHSRVGPLCQLVSSARSGLNHRLSVATDSVATLIAQLNSVASQSRLSTLRR